MNKGFFFPFVGLLFITVFYSCTPKNRMFSTAKEYMVDSIQNKIRQAEQDYVIQKNDYLTLKVFSNGGERIIDPDFELNKKEGGAKGEDVIKYLVKTDGTVDFPMIGNIKLSGYTLYQADSLLSIQYSKYYKDPFVVTRLLNKRVVVLGPISTAGLGVTVAGKVIPLENENMNLIEVLALFGGITDRGKSYNIRVIRGDLHNPDVSIIDLSTIEGMKKANLAVYPNDIIYIESSKKSFLEGVKDYGTLISIVINLIVISIVYFKK